MSVAVIYSNSLEAIFRSSPEHHLDYHRWNLCSLSMRINCSFVFVLVDDPLGSDLPHASDDNAFLVNIHKEDIKCNTSSNVEIMVTFPLGHEKSSISSLSSSKIAL
ncbi:hypothetical protein Tco_1402945 [Tanacetum coccineum]